MFFLENVRICLGLMKHALMMINVLKHFSSKVVFFNKIFYLNRELIFARYLLVCLDLRNVGASKMIAPQCISGSE